MAKSQRAAFSTPPTMAGSIGAGAPCSIGAHGAQHPPVHPQAVAASPVAPTAPSRLNDNDNNGTPSGPVHWTDCPQPDRGLTVASVLCLCGHWVNFVGLKHHFKEKCRHTKDSRFDMTGLQEFQARLRARAATIPIQSQVHADSKSSDGSIAPVKKYSCPDCGHVSGDWSKAVSHQKSTRSCAGSSVPQKTKVVRLQCGTWVPYNDTPTTQPIASASTTTNEESVTPTTDRPGEDPYPMVATSIDVPNERMPNSSIFSQEATAISLVKHGLCDGGHDSTAIAGLFHHRVADNPTGFVKKMLEDRTNVVAVMKDPPTGLLAIFLQLGHDVTFARTIVRELPGNVLATLQNFYDGAGSPEEVKSRGGFSARDNYAPIVKCGQFLWSYMWVFHRSQLNGVVEYMGRSGYNVREGYLRGILPGLLFDLVSTRDSITKAHIPLFDAMALMALTNHDNRLKARSNDEVARYISNMLHFVRLFAGCAKTILYMSHTSPHPPRSPLDIVEQVNKSPLIHHLCPILHSTRTEYNARPKTRDVHADQSGNITVRAFVFPGAALSQLYPKICSWLTSLFDDSLGEYILFRFTHTHAPSFLPRMPPAPLLPLTIPRLSISSFFIPHETTYNSPRIQGYTGATGYCRRRLVGEHSVHNVQQNRSQVLHQGHSNRSGEEATAVAGDSRPAQTCHLRHRRWRRPG